MDLLDTSVVSQTNFRGFKTPDRRKGLRTRGGERELKESLAVSNIVNLIKVIPHIRSHRYSN